MRYKALCCPCDMEPWSASAMLCFNPWSRLLYLTVKRHMGTRCVHKDVPRTSQGHRCSAGLICLTRLLMCREGDLVKQQQVAMRLHRQDKSNARPLWWIVTSLVLQARCAGASSSTPAILSSCQRWVCYKC